MYIKSTPIKGVTSTS